MGRASFIVLVALALAAAGVFTLDPEIDIRVSAALLAWAGRHHDGPLFRVLMQVRQTGPIVVAAAVAPAAVALAMAVIRPRTRPIMPVQAALFVVLTLVLGPGLLVNTALKEHWARPRPAAVTEFGGDLAFKPWWDPRGACVSNCSFVSGEVSSATWLAAPALVLPPPWRYLALAGVAVYVTSVAMARLVAGGHFLSDVIFAALFTGLMIVAVHVGLYRRPRGRATHSMGDFALWRIFGGIASLRRAISDKNTPSA